MALPSVNPRLIETAKTTAAARAASAVAQRMSPTTVRKVQQLLRAKQIFGEWFGQQPDEVEQPLLGGITLKQAREVFTQLQDAQLARKNLFFVRVIDYNPPPVEYAQGMYLTSLFNLFAIDVSYGPVTMTGEKIPIGSANIDRLVGDEPTELQITTMDDSRGSLKRWFDGKASQATHDDGTFGLPMEYLVDIEVYHATPQADERAYKVVKRYRPQAITHELSRREGALVELSMTFSQFDTFVIP